MSIKTAPPKPLPKLVIPLGLIIAGFAIYGFFNDLWHLYSFGTVVKEYRTGGGIGVTKPNFTEISGIAAWLQLFGEAGLAATGLSAVVLWLRKRFLYFFPLTIALLIFSNYLSGYGN
ncbi:MAG TPA: hypothetical protein PL131_00750 [Methylotenera sp.]|nr:hypothetical protein [Methylotenera sp.]HPH04375.1 hypothetical protein [Methylotenera sp.]HPM99929.1 hypothetical protein [Methylotenera sp.]